MISKSIINKLKEKGVAADIILDMILEDEQEEQKPETDQKAEQKPEEQKPAEQKPAEQKPDPDPILAAINKLTGVIQASNILNSGSKGPVTETADDILAQLINPKQGGNNNG